MAARILRSPAIRAAKNIQTKQKSVGVTPTLRRMALYFSADPGMPDAVARQTTLDA
jgi:hypothetical protein